MLALYGVQGMVVTPDTTEPRSGGMTVIGVDYTHADMQQHVPTFDPNSAATRDNAGGTWRAMSAGEYPNPGGG